MTVNHFTEAERYLSQASWRRDDSPSAPFTDPATAAISATLAAAHASLAGLPQQQHVAQGQLADAQRDLGVTQRVVGNVIAEALTDGPPPAQQWATNLAFALRSRHVSVDGLIEACMEESGLTFDPDGPSPAYVEPFTPDAVMRSELTRVMYKASANPATAPKVPALIAALHDLGITVDRDPWTDKALADAAAVAAPEQASPELMAYRAGMQSFRHLISRHIGHGLAFAETDEQHEMVRSLAQALDEAGLNLDLAIDEAVTSFGWDARLSWKAPSHRAEEPGIRAGGWGAGASDEPPF